MKQANRIYLKHKYQQNKNRQSPSFKSVVLRTINDPINKQQPGPGSYQLTLPLVKPKFQAIFKNNRSIIIKLNDAPVPPFFSKEERFKQYSTIQSKDNDIFDIRQLEKYMPNKIKNSRRYNFAAARKKNDNNNSSTMILTSKNGLDFQNNKTKGPQWSKYRQQRKVWRNSINSPGPGTYDQVIKQPKHYIDSKNSWQFRSVTKRSYSQKRDNHNQRFLIQQIPQHQKLNSLQSIHSRHNLQIYQY